MNGILFWLGVTFGIGTPAAAILWTSEFMFGIRDSRPSFFEVWRNTTSLLGFIALFPSLGAACEPAEHFWDGFPL